MKIYVSASRSRKPMMLNWRERLRVSGHKVLSEWLDDNDDIDVRAYDRTIKARVKRDLIDMQQASCVIVDTEVRDRAYMWIEVGVALERGIPIIGVGTSYGTLMYLPGIRLVSTIDELLDYLDSEDLEDVF